MAARTAAVLLSAAVLFGGGVGLGAWLAGGGASAPPATLPSIVQRATPKPANQVRDVPLPKMATAVPAPVEPKVVAAPPKPVPAIQPAPAAEPAAWQRYAVPASVRPGAPMIAIVLDDLGIDRRRSARAVSLPAPVTLAFLPYADDLDQQTGDARGKGHELLVHVPMQPHGQDIDPGPNVLDMKLGAIEVLSRLEWDLSRFDGFVGINNHMGSLFTESDEGMRLVAEGLRDRGLMFLDSLTSPKSVAALVAGGLGVPTVTRDVFLDNTDTAAEVEMRLAQAERVARQTGAAIAIGHPRDATLNVLEAWIPRALADGFVLVPVTTVLKARMAGSVQQASRP